MLGKLSQSSLATRILGTKPTLYCIGPIVGINLLRQFASKAKESDSKPTKQKKKDPLNIPEEPRKPSTPFASFYRDFFHEKRKNNPEYKVTEIARLAGAKWVKLPEDEKKSYMEQYKKNREKFSASYEKWLNSLTPQQIAQENSRRRLAAVSASGKKKRIKLLKDPKMPKRPSPPYIRFVTERMGNSEMKGSDRIKELAFEWKQLTANDKEPYNKAYMEAKNEYENKMKAYKEKRVITGR